ncbi:hypothetical protein ACFO25_02810 [Paenactinomyces guangxiensis]|uniref:Uncharacterized protein n=1 Tax=Paenactinomyces guangxiensis TaxID=1490290 RepID=A0A7W1WTB2_9BACL|nr:hypothetical protein [Paenactinomyces guangxiensis]MBA4495614.1 hypothetical protein [Paenactinomyces guangxiensis]MBH8592602.1 hypothetical protein [Paenactinomyces guangxiensis]
MKPLKIFARLIEDKDGGRIVCWVKGDGAFDVRVFLDLFREAFFRVLGFIWLPPFRLMSIYIMHLARI